MLPFLKPKMAAGLIISKRKPDGAGTEEKHMEGEENAGLEACAEDLIRAIHAKDAKGVAAAWKAGMDVMEESSEDDNSFDSQNAKAAEDAQE